MYMCEQAMRLVGSGLMAIAGKRHARIVLRAHLCVSARARAFACAHTHACACAHLCGARVAAYVPRPHPPPPAGRSLKGGLRLLDPRVLPLVDRGFSSTIEANAIILSECCVSLFRCGGDTMVVWVTASAVTQRGLVPKSICFWANGGLLGIMTETDLDIENIFYGPELLASSHDA